MIIVAFDKEEPTFLVQQDKRYRVCNLIRHYWKIMIMSILRALSMLVLLLYILAKYSTGFAKGMVIGLRLRMAFR